VSGKNRDREVAQFQASADRRRFLRGFLGEHRGETKERGRGYDYPAHDASPFRIRVTSELRGRTMKFNCRGRCKDFMPRKDRMRPRSAAASGYSSWPLRIGHT